MSGFVISYVPEVEKLPHPYFPLKKLNFQHGGKLHISPLENVYQAVYVPTVDCEFKGIHMCCTSYNIEDKYDVLIGSRYIIRDSNVKEMAEKRMLETYEVVKAGTPIVIQFHNISGLEKFMLYEIVLLMNEVVSMNPEDPEQLLSDWEFTWEGTSYQLNPQENMTLVINQPEFVDTSLTISGFEIDVTDMTMPEVVSTLSYSEGQVSSNYSEQDPEFQGLGLLGRVNTIGITLVTVYEHSIQIVFRNIDTINPHPIEIRLDGQVENN